MEMARYGRSVGLGLYSRGWAILRSAAIDIRGVATLSGTTFTAPSSGHGVAVSGQFLSRSGRSAARMASRVGPCGGDRVHPAEPTEPDGDGVRRDAMSERRPVLIDRIVRALSPGLRVEERRERIDAFDARVGAEPGDQRLRLRRILQERSNHTLLAAERAEDRLLRAVGAFGLYRGRDDEDHQRKTPCGDLVT